MTRKILYNLDVYRVYNKLNLCTSQFSEGLKDSTRASLHLTSSRSSYCSMSFWSFSASSMFSCRSLLLCELCCSIWASISLSVIWKCSVASLRRSSYSLNLWAFSSCHHNVYLVKQRPIRIFKSNLGCAWALVASPSGSCYGAEVPCKDSPVCCVPGRPCCARSAGGSSL